MVEELGYQSRRARVGEPRGLRVMRWVGWGIVAAAVMVFVGVILVRPARMEVWLELTFMGGVAGYIVRVAAVVTWSVLRMVKAREWRR